MSIERFRRGIGDPAEHSFKVFGVHRFAVCPAKIFAEAEDPLESVVRNFPFLSASGNRIPVFIQYCKTFADQLQQAGSICVHGL